MVTSHDTLAVDEFVDTHVHFWDLRNDRGLTYAWLEPTAVNPELGAVHAVKSLVYDSEAFQGETRFAGVSKVVHISAAKGTADPVAETSWLQALADQTGLPQAIIGYTRLDGEGVAASLERHAASRNFRGVRDLTAASMLGSPGFLTGFARLADHDMLFELDCTWEHMRAARMLADRFPQTPIVLDHGGFRRSTARSHYPEWKAAIGELAKAENVYCKISGFSLLSAKWTVESVTPWVMAALEAFGSNRCYFGTNWPVDRAFASYDAVVNAYRTVTATFSPSERSALLADNACRVYRI